MKDEVKEMLQTLHKLLKDEEGCLILLQAAFIYHSSKNLTECRKRADSIKAMEPQITKTMAEFARENQNLKPYVAVPTHLLRIAEDINKLAEPIERKIREGLLFSDRAVTEIAFLLQRLVDILRPVADIILVRNEILNRYIQESGTHIEKRAIEYSTLHEERLIEGVCIPAASSIYINMLDEIKSIAWHAREIAVKLS